MSLPKGFKRLEWIKADGASYINTNFAPNQDTRVYAECELPISASSNQGLFGARVSSSSSAFQFVTQGGYYRSDYNGTLTTISSSDYGTAKFYVDKNKSQTNLNGQYSGSAAYAAFSCPHSMYIFATNNNGSLYAQSSAKLFVMKIYDNGTLVRDFIPCQNASGAVGLWDAVNEEFYGNAGTGTFTAGPVVPETVDESEITELEYIESSGTQFFETGFTPNQDSRVIMDFDLTAVSSEGWASLFATRTDNSATRAFALFSNAAFGVAYDVYANASSQPSKSLKGRHLVDKNKNVTSLDGDVISTFTYATFTGDAPLRLLWESSATTQNKYPFIGKLYVCSIYDDGLLERDYVPAMLSNGEVGLYDRVFHEFYRNAGTGEFIAGPEMVHAGYTELEYIESSGAQFVETDVSIKSTSGFEVDFASVDVSSEKGLIGGFTYGGYNNNFGQYNGQWAAQYGNNQSIFFGTVDTERHTISQNVVQRSSYFDGELLQAELPFYDNTQRTFRLFCYNGGSSYPTFWIGSFRLYYCKIYDNGTEVRTYIPVLHPTGVAGLWDSVNERFYASATTTDLIAGPEAATVPKAPANFRVVSETDTLVTLAWDASDKALGYRLYRQGQLLTDTTETSVSVAVEPFAGAVFTVTAYNENGEGAGATLTHYSIPENPLLYLITDRTAQDVAERNPKGYYAASDLNRVGYAMNYVAERITAQGHVISVSPKLNWTDAGWVSTADAVAYLKDLTTLRGAVAVLSSTPTVPADMEGFTFSEANDIELILLAVDQLLTLILNNLLYAGEVFAGEV